VKAVRLGLGGGDYRELLNQRPLQGIAANAGIYSDDICHLFQAALAAAAEGLLQTTWMGHFPDERALKTQLRPFTTFVLAAECAWSGRRQAPSQLSYDPQEVFRKAHARSP